jgi:hypothetical protein
MNRLVVPLAVAFTIAVSSSASAHHHHWRSCGCSYDYCGSASCCTASSSCAPVSCCNSTATASGDSAATTDQSVTTTDSTPPSPGDTAVPWTDEDEKRFAECTKNLKPNLKQQILDEMKKMTRTERDEEFSYYEKTQREETEKSKDQGKSSGEKTSQKTEARRSQPVGAMRSKLTNAQPASITVIMLEPVR